MNKSTHRVFHLDRVGNEGGCGSFANWFWFLVSCCNSFKPPWAAILDVILSQLFRLVSQKKGSNKNVPYPDTHWIPAIIVFT